LVIWSNALLFILLYPGNMNKISTHNFLQVFKKLSLAAAFALASAFVQAYSPHSFFPAAEFGIQAKTIKCYPNPAISFVNFEFTAELISKNYTLQVYSFTGKKMYEISITSLKATLTFTNEFYRGIYVYQLRDKSGRIIETGKFQVVR